MVALLVVAMAITVNSATDHGKIPPGQEIPEDIKLPPPLIEPEELGKPEVFCGLLEYFLPSKMKPCTGHFGIYHSSSGDIYTGYHWDDPNTICYEEQNIPTHWRMPSPYSNAGVANALDYHWIWAGENSYVIWDMFCPVYAVRVFPAQDHGPYPEEFVEYDVFGSNDLTTWVSAIGSAPYVDDLAFVRTLDGPRDFTFAAGNPAYRYIKIQPNANGGWDMEIDAVQALTASCCCVK